MSIIQVINTAATYIYQEIETASMIQDNIQPFTLHYFTWSNNRAAGYNIWAGGRYGAVDYIGLSVNYVNLQKKEVLKC